ncbi:MAG: hypothetical protein RQ729_07755 [Wenzhouxiangellaceae bacterium]|nr:hypothetical protein [Wenzhouxiangellaceae bacterium]
MGTLVARAQSYQQRRRDFWKNKIESNIKRDDRSCFDLMARGWKVLTIWQCEIANDSVLISKFMRISYE